MKYGINGLDDEILNSIDIKYMTPITLRVTIEFSRFLTNFHLSTINMIYYGISHQYLYLCKDPVGTVLHTELSTVYHHNSIIELSVR